MDSQIFPSLTPPPPETTWMSPQPDICKHLSVCMYVCVRVCDTTASLLLDSKQMLRWQFDPLLLWLSWVGGIWALAHSRVSGQESPGLSLTLTGPPGSLGNVAVSVCSWRSQSTWNRVGLSSAEEQAGAWPVSLSSLARPLDGDVPTRFVKNAAIYENVFPSSFWRTCQWKHRHSSHWFHNQSDLDSGLGRGFLV